MSKIALYAGSFDPYTNGHRDIVRKAAALFDGVVVMLAVNTAKRRAFDTEAMRRAIEQTARADGLENVRAVAYDGLIADYCAREGIRYYVRGLRNNMDYDYEENIARINHRINPALETLYLRADDDVVSSSMVRELLRFGKNVDDLVPEAVLEIL